MMQWTNQNSTRNMQPVPSAGKAWGTGSIVVLHLVSKCLCCLGETSILTDLLLSSSSVRWTSNRGRTCTKSYTKQVMQINRSKQDVRERTCLYADKPVNKSFQNFSQIRDYSIKLKELERIKDPQRKSEYHAGDCWNNFTYLIPWYIISTRASCWLPGKTWCSFECNG